MVPIHVLLVTQQLYSAAVCYGSFKFVKNFPQNFNTLGQLPSNISMGHMNM